MERVVVQTRNVNGTGIRTGKVHGIGGRNLVNVVVRCDEEKIVISGHNYMRPTYATYGNTTKTTSVTMLEKTMFDVVHVAKGGENVK